MIAGGAAVVVVAAVLGAGAAGCRKREPASESAPGSNAAAARGGAPGAPPPLAEAAFYRIDAGPQTPCVAGAQCEARLVLTALGKYKVNKEYPFKFVADGERGVLVEGTGSFAFDDAKTGTLTIRFRAARAGRAHFAGRFKLSVCTEEVCEIEQPKIELELPITAAIAAP